MKICYVGNYTQSHCTEVHIAATLEKLGHEVVRIQESTEAKPNWMDELPADTDLFLYTRTWGNMVTMADLEVLRDNGIKSASYHLDLYIGLKREDGLDNDPFWRTDYVFTPDGDPASAEVFKRKGINHHYIKPGVYEEECEYIEVLSHDIDVLFVGGGEATGGIEYGHKEWPYRGQLIKFLQDTYGDRFVKKGWPQETIRNAELNVLYCKTKVTIGDSLCLNFNHPYYWSDRVYETMGRGGFIIHPFIEGMQEEFTDGENIVFYDYNDWDGLKAKIDYYLEHDQEREKIRRAGHEFVKKYATYTQRLSQAVSIIFPNRVTDVEQLIGRIEEAQAKTPEIEGVKISLGAGSEPEDGDWINLDIVPLPGIDVVHDLDIYRWPFGSNSASYIKAKDVIEHMSPRSSDNRPGVIAFIEECHRILKTGGTLWIQTPSWKADFFWIDPTHVRPFDIRTFDFFDPDTDFGRSTGFYSDAKFKVTASETENYNLIVEMVKR